MGGCLESLIVGCLKDELAFFHDFVLPCIEGVNLILWEGDFNDLEVHEMKHIPNVPALGYMDVALVVDLTAGFGVDLAFISSCRLLCRGWRSVWG